MFTVTSKAKRPATNKNECTYCHQSIGDEHKDDCVLISKKVRVRMTVEYEIEVPAYWGKSDIEFHRNEGSWCANNAISELDEYFEQNPCMCNTAYFEYLGGDSEPYLDED